MLGWFANAIMAGYDNHRWKMEKERRDLAAAAAEPVLSMCFGESCTYRRCVRRLSVITDKDGMEFCKEWHGLVDEANRLCPDLSIRRDTPAGVGRDKE